MTWKALEWHGVAGMDRRGGNSRVGASGKGIKRHGMADAGWWGAFGSGRVCGGRQRVMRIGRYGLEGEERCGGD